MWKRCRQKSEQTDPVLDRLLVSCLPAVPLPATHPLNNNSDQCTSTRYQSKTTCLLRNMLGTARNVRTVRYIWSNKVLFLSNDYYGKNETQLLKNVRNCVVRHQCTFCLPWRNLMKLDLKYAQETSENAVLYDMSMLSLSKMVAHKIILSHYRYKISLMNCLV